MFSCPRHELPLAEPFQDLASSFGIEAIASAVEKTRSGKLASTLVNKLPYWKMLLSKKERFNNFRMKVTW